MEFKSRIIIVGAGPAGTSAAYHLAKEGIEVLLLDKAKFPRDKVCGDGLSPSAIKELEIIGIKNKVLQKSNPVDGCYIYSPNNNFFKVEDYTPLVYIIKRKILDDLLLEKAENVGVKFVENVKIVDIEGGFDRVTLKDNCGNDFFADLAIIASGSNSSLPIHMKLLKKPPADAMASRAYFRGINPDLDKMVFCYNQDILPAYGWIFPLGNGMANVGVGYFFEKSEYPNLKKIWQLFVEWVKKEGFADQNTEQITPLETGLLRMGLRRNKLYDKRIILAGDSASTVNPLSGEGIYYALESGRVAASVIQNALESDDFSKKLLSLYKDVLKNHNKSRYSGCLRFRKIMKQKWIVNRLVSKARKTPELADKIYGLLVGEVHPREIFELSTLFKVIF